MCLWCGQVDLLYMQNLRSIAEIHETGVTAENFHEVSRYCIISTPVTFLLRFCAVCCLFCLYVNIFLTLVCHCLSLLKVVSCFVGNVFARSRIKCVGLCLFRTVCKYDAVFFSKLSDVVTELLLQLRKHMCLRV